MIVEQIKKDNMQAMKDRNTNLRNIYSIILTKYMQVSINARGTEQQVGDVEMVKIIQKTIKELAEERDNYLKVNNQEESNNIELQRKALEKYLPSLLSEDEILKIINSLDDKTLPSIMRHFKTNYNGKCDMGIVSKVAKSL